MKKLILLLALLSTPAWAANAFVQKCIKTQAAAATITCTLAGAVTAGNFIAVGIAQDISPGTVTTVADQAANGYTIIGPCTNSGTARVAYRGNVPGTGASTTVITATFSPTGTGIQSIWVREFSGLDTASPIDASSAASCTGTGTTINLPSITPTVTGDLLYGVAYTAGTITATGGSWAAADGNIQNGEADEYTLSGTTSATTVNWAQNSAAWAAVIASFKTATSSATPTGNKADKLQNLEGAALR